MDNSKIVIRTIQEKDIPFVLRVNEENVEVLSPMDEAKLRRFMGYADMLQVVEADGELAAFMIVLREGIDEYDSENYRWFCKHYEKFLYIDRVVIDEPFRSMGIGRMMYEAVFAQARANGVGSVTAEIDTIPYNEASLKFHDVMGFKEVGEQLIRNNTIKVSLQERTIE